MACPLKLSERLIRRAVQRQEESLAPRLSIRKGVSGNHPPDGSPALFAHLSGGRFASLFLVGAPRPHTPSPGLRCPLRSAPCLCATGARRPFVKGGRKLYLLLPTATEFPLLSAFPRRLRRAARSTCRLSLRRAKTLIFSKTFST